MSWRYTLPELARILGVPDTGVAGVFDGVSTDTRSLTPGQVFFALKGDNFDGNRFAADALRRRAAAAVVTEACDEPHLLVKDGLEALQQFAAHHRAHYEIPLIAITGSCGKTSAKDFAAALLRTRREVVKTQGNLNNEIGCPLSLLQIDGVTEVALIEMGANHEGEIAQLCRLARPTESAVTMVAPAHLEGFGSVEKVAEAKGEIAEALGANGVFYENVDDPWCGRIAGRFPGEKVRFGSVGDVRLVRCALGAGGELELEIDPVGRLCLPLPVPAQAANVLLAVAIGLRHGVEEFEGPLREACARSTRFCLVEVGPFEVLDDTYNANPASMAAALEALASRPGEGARIAVLGEMLELGEGAGRLHEEVGEVAGQRGVSHLFARGPHASVMIEAARRAGVPHAEAIEDHGAMAGAIREAAPAGGAVLIKGSRGMRMECVLRALRELISEEPELENPPGRSPRER